MCLSCHRTKEKQLFQHQNAIEENQKIKENKTEPTRTMQPIKPPIESNVRWEMHLHFKINCSFFFSFEIKAIDRLNHNIHINIRTYLMERERIEFQHVFNC